MIAVGAKVDSNFRGIDEAFVTVRAPSRFYRLSPAEARDLAKELVFWADEAESRQPKCATCGRVLADGRHRLDWRTGETECLP